MTDRDTNGRGATLRHIRSRQSRIFRIETRDKERVKILKTPLLLLESNFLLAGFDPTLDAEHVN